MNVLRRLSHDAKQVVIVNSFTKSQNHCKRLLIHTTKTCNNAFFLFHEMLISSKCSVQPMSETFINRASLLFYCPRNTVNSKCSQVSYYSLLFMLIASFIIISKLDSRILNHSACVITFRNVNFIHQLLTGI